MVAEEDLEVIVVGSLWGSGSGEVQDSSVLAILVAVEEVSGEAVLVSEGHDLVSTVCVWDTSLLRGASKPCEWLRTWKWRANLKGSSEVGLLSEAVSLDLRYVGDRFSEVRMIYREAYLGYRATLENISFVSASPAFVFKCQPLSSSHSIGLSISP